MVLIGKLARRKPPTTALEELALGRLIFYQGQPGKRRTDYLFGIGLRLPLSCWRVRQIEPSVRAPASIIYY
jgi:hypothetical protein